MIRRSIQNLSHPRAGELPITQDLISLSQLEERYHEARPEDCSPIRFGTSGHRGSPLNGSFNKPHIEAIVQAICEYRKTAGISGPMYVGWDTHAISIHAFYTAMEVLLANDIQVYIEQDLSPIPTPVISRLLINHNRLNPLVKADGLIITPSHNPPEDGGIKYNPPHGGPAESEVTFWIEKRANQILQGGNKDVKKTLLPSRLNSPLIKRLPLKFTYVKELANVVNVEAIKNAGLKLGVDPLGGSTLYCWQTVNEYFKLNLHILNPALDPRFSFLHLDHDGKIRMDCSSPYVMKGVIKESRNFDIVWACDTDGDRHGIVVQSTLLNPNLYLALAIDYLIHTRKHWNPRLKIGKTVVSSSVIDKVSEALSRQIYEVPVGFKWFSRGLYEGWLAFGGEESAGASFLQFDGTVWTTDKDGIIMGLLSAEIMAITEKNPLRYAEDLQNLFGKLYYKRIDIPLEPQIQMRLSKLSHKDIKIIELASYPVQRILFNAPGNNEPIGGVKICTEKGWFAIRTSGTEPLAKIYCESYIDEMHLETICEEAINFAHSL